MQNKRILSRLRQLEAAAARRTQVTTTAARGFGITAVVAALALPAVATALSDVPNTFAEGDLITAAEMNDNFSHLVDEVTALEERGPDEYCGATAAGNGDVGGYAGGAAVCRAACGDASAHICDSHELVRFAGSGGVTPSGWFATGVWSDWSNNGDIDDCGGFNDAGGTALGMVWNAEQRPTLSFCFGANFPLLCCAPS